jgi:phage terminase large subunit-like protein
MASLNFKLHDAQLEIFKSDAKYKVVAAGRRFGKSFLSAICLLIEGLKNENEEGTSLKDKRVFYVAPTFDQGKRIIWDLIKDLGNDVIESTLENQAIIKLINGRKIEIKGADRPDTLRGVGLSYVVLDEYAFMKPDVWEQIIYPTLTDVKGHALFIGTPDGKNHFYDLYTEAHNDENWEAFSYTSFDNPTLDPKEIDKARKTMSTSNFKQEFEASFAASGGTIFKDEYFRYLDKEPEDGTWFVSVDPAGFADLETTTQGKLSRLDECAIASIKVGPYGWYVGDIMHGRWGVRETSIRILRAAQKYNALVVGIERGSLKNAIMPYLHDQMLRLGTFPRIKETTHGNKKKTERIAWALEGRFEHGRIFFKKDADYLSQLTSQLIDFPNPLAKDDLIDALAYTDQIAETDYSYDEEEETDMEFYEDEIDGSFLGGRSHLTGY